MSNPGEEDGRPIGSVQELAAYLAGGCKPRDAFRIGTEHEKFGFRQPGSDVGGDPPAYAPPAYEHGGIRAMLEGIA